jgi:integrase
MKKNIQTPNKPLSPAQRAKVLSVAESEMKGLILVAITTGQRLRDIIAIERGDIDRTRNTIRFRVGKLCMVVEATLDPRVRNWMEQQPDSPIPVDLDTPLFPQLAARGPTRTAGYLRTLGEKVGVAVSEVSLRNTCFQQLIANGTPVAVVRQLMGYRSRK